MFGIGEKTPTGVTPDTAQPAATGTLTESVRPEGAAPAAIDPALEAAKPPATPPGPESVLPKPTPDEQKLQPFPTYGEKAKMDETYQNAVNGTSQLDKPQDWTSLDQTPQSADTTATSPEVKADDIENDPEIAKLKEALDAAILGEQTNIKTAETAVVNSRDVLRKLVVARDSIPGVLALKQLGHVTLTPSPANNFTEYTKFDAEKRANNPQLPQAEQTPELANAEAQPVATSQPASTTS